MSHVWLPHLLSSHLVLRSQQHLQYYTHLILIVSQWDQYHKGLRGSERGEGEKNVWATWVLSSRGSKPSRFFLKIRPAGRTVPVEDFLKPPDCVEEWKLSSFQEGRMSSWQHWTLWHVWKKIRLRSLFPLPALHKLWHTFSPPKYSWAWLFDRHHLPKLRDGLRYVSGGQLFSKIIYQLVNLISVKSSLVFLFAFPNRVLAGIISGSAFCVSPWPENSARVQGASGERCSSLTIKIYQQGWTFNTFMSSEWKKNQIMQDLLMKQPQGFLTKLTKHWGCYMTYRQKKPAVNIVKMVHTFPMQCFTLNSKAAQWNLLRDAGSIGPLLLGVEG